MSMIREMEALISAAFQGGAVRRRELRLTADQADYIRAHWAARVVPMEPRENPGWYEVIFQGVEC